MALTYYLDIEAVSGLSSEHILKRGSIFIAGVGIQWLHDELGLIKNANEWGALATSLASDEAVYFVAAFTGLGHPTGLPMCAVRSLG